MFVNNKRNKKQTNMATYSGDILNIQEHLSCKHYVSDYRCSFTCRTVECNHEKRINNREYNYLIFMLEGSAVVDCGEYSRNFVEGDIFLIPKFVEARFVATSKCKVISCVYDSLETLCSKFNLTTYWANCGKINYDFRPVAIHPRMRDFLDQLTYFLEQGVKCKHYHLLKMQEMFFIFRWLYTGEQIIQLFYPITGQISDFWTFVMKNYTKVQDVKQFAGLAGMSRTNFEVAFKKEFNMSVKQWMLKQKAKHIKAYMSTPNVCINDVIFKFDFNSPTHFTRFCKNQFGCTPSEMKASLNVETEPVGSVE